MKKTNTNNIPKLRFPEFKDEWKEKKLGTVFNILAGGDIKKSDISKNKDQLHFFPVYANALTHDGLIGFSTKPKINVNSITVTGRGDIGHAVVRNSGFTPVVRLLTLTPKTKSSTYFFTNAINKIKIFAESTGVPQLTVPQLSGYKIHSTSFEEQQKIADFLTTVDEKITALNKKVELLKKYKKGVMQKIFSQEIRFKDKNGNEYPDWNNRQIKNLALVNPKTSDLPKEFTYIDLESVIEGRLLFRKKMKIENAPSRAQRLLRKLDILYQTVRPYQKNNLFFDLSGDYIASTGYAQLRAKENPIFLYQLLHTDRFVHDVLLRCTGTSYPAINSDDLSKIDCRVPSSIKEQQKIAEFLSSIDDIIRLEEEKFEQVKKFKKSLIQQMFI